MNHDDSHERIAELISARAFNPDVPKPSDMTEREWDHIGRLAAVESVLFDQTHPAPALENDPVAKMLGLVPDPHLVLDGKALARARRNAHLKPSDLANALTGRGWIVSTGEVSRWETRPAQLPPALIDAVATVTRTSADRITTDRAPFTSILEQVAALPAYRTLVTRFASLNGLSLTAASAGLQRSVLATQHRGDEPDPDQLLRTLDAYVTALEERADPPPPAP